MSKSRLVIGLLGIATIIGMANETRADITYYLDGVTLDDGGTLSGSFTTDGNFANLKLISADIVSTSTNHEYVVPSAPNTPPQGNAAVTAGSLSITDFISSSSTTYSLLFLFSAPLTSSGTFGIITGGGSFEATVVTGKATVNVATGSVVADPPAAPEPSSVVMVSSALVIGLGLTWRKQRRVAA